MSEEKNSVDFLAAVADMIALSLRKKLNVAPEKATDVALDVADEIRRMWGGVAVYICKTDTEALDEKYEAVWEAYRKEGFSLDLVRRFGLSEQRLRQIIAIKRREGGQKVVVTPLLDAS